MLVAGEDDCSAEATVVTAAGTGSVAGEAGGAPAAVTRLGVRKRAMIRNSVRPIGTMTGRAISLVPINPRAATRLARIETEPRMKARLRLM